jgi:site-specific DNA-methyltransferase (adenine-specific)/adenine-specific DNA-methyltransferase
MQLGSDRDSVVLDSFAGSGTTAHAVLQLNKEDGGNRKFILVEMEEKICREITAERVKRVAEGYTNSKGKLVEGLGGGFRFCTLGDTLFDADGQIRKSVSFSDLARHIFLTETGEPLPKQNNGRTPLLGVVNGTAYYLLYNGILSDKRANGGNVLTRAVLADLPSHDGPRVIFGTGCRIGAGRLARAGVTFRQIPYSVKVR